MCSCDQFLVSLGRFSPFALLRIKNILVYKGSKYPLYRLTRRSGLPKESPLTLFVLTTLETSDKLCQCHRDCSPFLFLHR